MNFERQFCTCHRTFTVRKTGRIIHTLPTCQWYGKHIRKGK